MVFRKYPATVKSLTVRYVLEGKSRSTIRRLLGQTMHKKTIDNWMILYWLTRAVIRDPSTKKICGRKRRLGVDARNTMRELVNSSPHLFLSEIRSSLYDTHGTMVSLSTIQLELQSRLMLTLKKAGVGDYQKSLRRKAKCDVKVCTVAPFLC